MSMMPPPGYADRFYDLVGPWSGDAPFSQSGTRPPSSDAAASGTGPPGDTSAGAKAPSGDKPGDGTSEPPKPKTYATREAGWSDKFWKEGKSLTSKHQANLTGESLDSWQGALGLVATGVAGDNLAGKVPDLPDKVVTWLPFLDDWSQWAKTQAGELDQTQLLEKEQIGPDGQPIKQSEHDYVQIRGSAISGKLNQGETGLVQASGGIDFAQQSLSGSVTSTDGQTLSLGADIDEQRLSAGYGGSGHIGLSAGADLKHQSLDGSITSTDGQRLSARGDLNDKALGLGYDGGAGKVAVSAEGSLEARSLSGQISSSDDGVTAGSSLGLSDGVQTDSFVAFSDQDAPAQTVEDKARVKIGRRTGLGFEHTIKDVPVAGQTAEADRGWNAGAYYDRRTGRKELSGGLKNSVQAGVAVGGDEGSQLSLSLGEHVVGKQLKSVSASVTAKPGDFKADLGLGQHKSSLRLNGTGVEASLSVPLGVGSKAPSLGGGFKYSGARDVLSESLSDCEAPDGSCAEHRSLSLSDDLLWGGHAKFVSPSGIAGKLSVEQNRKQSLSWSGDAAALPALPAIEALEDRLDQLNADQRLLEQTEASLKKQLSELRAERKKIVEKQEQPRLTREGRAEKLKDLDAAIRAQETELSQAASPEAKAARQTKIQVLAAEAATVAAELAPLQARRAELAEALDQKISGLFDLEAPEASLEQARALPKGQAVSLQIERELGWELEAGLKSDATGSFGHTGIARLDLQLESLGEGKLLVRAVRQFERDLSLKGQVAGMAKGERLGEQDNTKAYSLELDLDTPAGRAAYTALLKPAHRLSEGLPELKAAKGVTIRDESLGLRQAVKASHGLSIGKDVTLRSTRSHNLNQHFDQDAGSSQYTGTASRTGLQDSKRQPLIGKIFGHEEVVTGANYELRSNGDQSFSLKLRLSDERVKHKEAVYYQTLYQQSGGQSGDQGAASMAPSRRAVRQYNDGSSLAFNLELALKPADLSAIAGASCEQLLAAARVSDGVSGIEARFFEHRLQKAEQAAAEEAKALGLDASLAGTHVQAARLREVLEFIEHHGEAAVPYLQALCGRGIETCSSGLERGGYRPETHLKPERLSQIQAQVSALGPARPARKQRREAEDLREELADALASLEGSLAALAQDPLIPSGEKATARSALSAHKRAVQTELKALDALLTQAG